MAKLCCFKLTKATPFLVFVDTSDVKQIVSVGGLPVHGHRGLKILYKARCTNHVGTNSSILGYTRR